MGPGRGVISYTYNPLKMRGLVFLFCLLSNTPVKNHILWMKKQVTMKVTDKDLNNTVIHQWTDVTSIMLS